MGERREGPSEVGDTAHRQDETAREEHEARDR
jgi:hypothetical protein